MKEKSDLIKMEKLFLALSDKTRLRILNLLSEKEISVHYFTEVLAESQPKISRHLAYLRSSGVVSARREGKWIYYTITMPENEFVSALLQNTLRWLGSRKDMQRDRERFYEIYRSSDPKTKKAEPFINDIYGETNAKKRNEELEVFLL